MTKSILFLVFCLLGSIAASAQSQSTSSDLLQERLYKLSGKFPLNCGMVGIGESPDKATNCALASFTIKQPFYISYFERSLDSESGEGLAYDGAKIFSLDFDSMGWSREGLKKSDTITDGNHIIIHACPRPFALYKTQNGRLTCFPPSSPKTKGNVMSPHFEY